MARKRPQIDVKLEGLDRLQNRLARTQAKLRNPETLTAGLAAMMEAQVKTRIQDEKRAPDGSAWRPWSAEYAAGQSSNHSLLLFEGHLRDSIAGSNNKTSATVGADMIYAGWHQFGPYAREYLGISKENTREIDHLTEEWLAGALD